MKMKIQQSSGSALTVTKTQSLFTCGDLWKSTAASEKKHCNVHEFDNVPAVRGISYNACILLFVYVFVHAALHLEGGEFSDAIKPLTVMPTKNCSYNNTRRVLAA